MINVHQGYTYPVISLFSGVGGLELGARQFGAQDAKHKQTEEEDLSLNVLNSSDNLTIRQCIFSVFSIESHVPNVHVGPRIASAVCFV